MYQNREQRVLLDHMMFTQNLVGGKLPLVVNPHAGKAEHEVHDNVNATLTAKRRASDHRPVSVVLQVNT